MSLSDLSERGADQRASHQAGLDNEAKKQGNHITDDKNTGYTGEPKFTGKNFQPVKFGNEVALNVGKGGCGTGRTIYATGSQDQHGDVAGNQKPAGRDILGSFGPESSRPRGEG